MLSALAGSVFVGVGLGIVYRVGIVILGLISLSLESALYGLLCILLTSYIIEKITVNGTSSYMAHVISDKYEEINNYLNHRNLTFYCHIFVKK